MSLLEQINADRLDAMKAKAAGATTRKILTTLKGAIEQVNSKGATDEEVKAAVKSAIKGVNDMKAILKKAHGEDFDTPEQDYEISVLSKYMPEKFDELRTHEIVQDTIAQVGFESMADMGKVMGALSKYGEELDKGLANKILRESLK